MQCRSCGESGPCRQSDCGWGKELIGLGSYLELFAAEHRPLVIQTIQAQLEAAGIKAAKSGVGYIPPGLED